MGAAGKDAENEFFGSKYATLASVVKVLKEPLGKQGIFYSQAVHTEEHRVGLELRVALGSQEIVSPILWLPFDSRGKSVAQAVGSSISYGRRYQLMAFFGIPQEDDDGNDAGTPPKKVKAQRAKRTSPTSAEVYQKSPPMETAAELPPKGGTADVGVGPPDDKATQAARVGDYWVNYGKDITLRFDGETWEPQLKTDAPYQAAHEAVTGLLIAQAKVDKITKPVLFEMLRSNAKVEEGFKTFSEVPIAALAQTLEEMRMPY